MVGCHPGCLLSFCEAPKGDCQPYRAVEEGTADRGHFLRTVSSQCNLAMIGNSPNFDIPVPMYRNKKKPVRTYRFSRSVLTVS